MIERPDNPHCGHWGNAVVRGKDNVPAGMTRNDLSQHFFVAFIGHVPDTHAEFFFEVRNSVRRDVSRPVENVQSGTPVPTARHRTGTPRTEEKNPALHDSLRRSEIRIIAPKITTMRAEIA